MQVVGLRTFSSSQKFIIKPHKFFLFLAGSHKTLIMGIQRSKTEFSTSQEGVEARRAEEDMSHFSDM